MVARQGPARSRGATHLLHRNAIFGQRGAVAIEAAILLPFLVLLAFGVVELAQLMRSHIAVTTIAREAARTGSAESRLDGFTLDAASAAARSAESLDFSKTELWVYRAATSDGQPPATCATSTCERFVWNNATPGAFVRVNMAGSPTGASWTAATINACITDPDGVDRRDWLGVWVKARHDYLTKLVLPGSSTDVKARSVMKFEPVIIPARPGETNNNLKACKA